MKEGNSVDIIQFMDDTLIIGGDGWKNSWGIKAILRGFELLGLGVNYQKSRLIDINMSNHFLLAASNFLDCKLQNSNFSLIGILIGSNLRRIKM